MLAVNRIRFVPVQAALRALMLDLGGLEDGARQLHKKRDAHDHDEHRQQFSAGCRHGDVAKARRRKRRHCEIERVDIAADASGVIESQHEYKRRGHEDEDEQVDRSEDRVFVAAKEQALAPKVTQQVIGVDQPQSPQHSQECEGLDQKRRQQQGQDDDQISNGVDARQFPAQVIGDPEPGRKVQKYKQAKPSVQYCRDRRRGQRRCCNEIDDGQSIENDQPISKPPGAPALTGVEQPNRSVQFFHLRNMPQVFAQGHEPRPRLACGPARGACVRIPEVAKFPHQQRMAGSAGRTAAARVNSERMLSPASGAAAVKQNAIMLRCGKHQRQQSSHCSGVGLLIRKRTRSENAPHHNFGCLNFHACLKLQRHCRRPHYGQGHRAGRIAEIAGRSGA